MLSPFHDNKFRTFGFSYKGVSLFYFISFYDDEIPLLGIIVKIPGTCCYSRIKATIHLKGGELGVNTIIIAILKSITLK